MRLTDGIGRRLVLGNKYSTQLFDKLKLLEDIEEELGIELPDFIRILKYLEEVYAEDSDKPFYVKGVLNEIESIYPVYMHMEIKNKRLCEKYNMDRPDDTFYYFKDYGKTWALTKKELK